MNSDDVLSLLIAANQMREYLDNVKFILVTLIF